MKEDLLHFVWRFQYYDHRTLKTTCGDTIQIIHPGYHNHNAGPDFLNAHIKINTYNWHGHVEIHIRSSDWDKHRHSGNPDYANVILHVVYQEDRSITYYSGEKIPCLALQGLIAPDVLHRYEALSNNLKWIPCSGMLQRNLSTLLWTTWVERLLVERLEQRVQWIERLFEESHQHWEVTFYYALAYGYGLKVNSAAFLELARRIPRQYYAQYRDQPLYVEGMLFGCAGWLKGSFQDNYPQQLQKAFGFLQHKHNLKSRPILFKFHRMRPPSFPTVRLAQFAALMIRHHGFVHQLLEIDDLQVLKDHFHVECNSYWNDHVRFDQTSRYQKKMTGTSFWDQLVINVIVPFLFFYGIKTGNQWYKDRALRWMQALRPENNAIIRQWKQEGVVPLSAADTQALYYLKKAYCDAFRCLNCSFGHRILT